MGEAGEEEKELMWEESWAFGGLLGERREMISWKFFYQVQFVRGDKATLATGAEVVGWVGVV